MKLIKKRGIFNPDGDIVLHPGISFSWSLISNTNIPELPQGIPVDIEISIDEQTLLSGDYGIVWATHDLRQAEVICNALLAQNIASAIKRIDLDTGSLLLLRIDNAKDASEAIDFIWRKEGGLRLKPDWTYPDGEPNTSFDKWLQA
jgi:hypothetical protein